MRRYLVVLATASVALTAGCKGKTKYRDRKDTLDALDKCRHAGEQKQKYIATLEAKLAKHAEKHGEEGEVVVNVMGDGTLKITGGRGPYRAAKPQDPTMSAKDEELYKAFLAKVNGSRGKMKKCYQTALKKDSSLQARTITLKVIVKYKASGKVSSASFDKPLKGTFGSCLTAVAKKWQLPATSRGVTFRTPVTLTPQ